MDQPPLRLSAAAEKKTIVLRQLVGRPGRSPPLEVVWSSDDDAPVVDEFAHRQIGVAWRSDAYHHINSFIDRIDHSIRQNEIRRHFWIGLDQVAANRTDVRATKCRRRAYPKHPARFDPTVRQGCLGLIDFRENALRSVEEPLSILGESKTTRRPHCQDGVGATFQRCQPFAHDAQRQTHFARRRRQATHSRDMHERAQFGDVVQHAGPIMSLWWRLPPIGLG